MVCMLEVVRSDNEENAVQALKIIIDLHRNHKAVLEEHVQPFLTLVQTLYTNMKDTVKEAFGEAKEGSGNGQVSYYSSKKMISSFQINSTFLPIFDSLPTLLWQLLLQLENQQLVAKVLLLLERQVLVPRLW